MIDDSACISGEPCLSRRSREASEDGHGRATRSSCEPRAFPRTARLLDGRGYDRVFSNNRRVGDRYWTVLSHAPDVSNAQHRARLGLAIAKKRAKRAVDRNRIKRIVRESFRHRQAALGSRQVVVMNRDAAISASRDELRQSLDVLWDRLLRQAPGNDSGARQKSRTSGRVSVGRES